VAAPTNKFPTISDLRDRLSDLIDRGLGDLPVQVLVVPAFTTQAIAQASGGYNDLRPALMIELTDEKNNGRIPVSIISSEYLSPEYGDHKSTPGDPT
jgi:hypothetical protein